MFSRISPVSSIGGAVANLAGELRVTNVTLHENEATTGSGLFSLGQLTLANTILNGDDEQCVSSGSLTAGTPEDGSHLASSVVALTYFCASARSDFSGLSANKVFHIRGVKSTTRLAGCSLMRCSTSTRYV